MLTLFASSFSFAAARLVDRDRRNRGRLLPVRRRLAPVRRKLTDVRATAEVTCASVDNLKLIRDGKADLAFTLADTLAEAVDGRGAFRAARRSGSGPRGALSNYTSSSSCFVRDRAVAGLKGNTCRSVRREAARGNRFPGAPAAGIDPDPTSAAVARRVGIGRRAEGRQDRCVLLSGGLPTAAIQDLSHTSGIAVRMVPNADLVPALQRSMAISTARLRFPPALIRAWPRPCRRRRREPAGRQPLPAGRSRVRITKALFEHQSELAAIHPEARNLSSNPRRSGRRPRSTRRAPVLRRAQVGSRLKAQGARLKPL